MSHGGLIGEVNFGFFFGAVENSYRDLRTRESQVIYISLIHMQGPKIVLDPISQINN